MLEERFCGSYNRNSSVHRLEEPACLPIGASHENLVGSTGSFYNTDSMKNLLVFSVALLLPTLLPGQSLGSAGTVQGTVVDPSGAAIANAAVTILNRVTNYRKSIKTDASGAFRFNSVPPNSYHLEADAANFSQSAQDVEVRGAVPVVAKFQLALVGTKTNVTVEAGGADMIENVPYAHNDVEMSGISKLPISSPGSGLSDAITLSTGAVAADSNGFFHPLGDHAQTSFSVDGQPISDQQSKQFSTQVPLNAIQSMELITGAPPAEYGDKTSLIVNAVTRSGLGQKTNGSLLGQWGSFGTYSEEATLGVGGARWGNFISANGMRSGRFLDTPEFTPLHAIGNNATIFDHFDYLPNAKDTLHLNILGARNWFQVPNTYDQLRQDQHQKISTFNFAPGYQHTYSSTTLVTINGFYRADKVNYYASRIPSEDTPLTFSQRRTLTNWGAKADIAQTKGRHNWKVGTQLMQTRLNENFAFGITDPTYNAVCVNSAGDPQELPKITDPKQCAATGFAPNPGLSASLIPYDLSRGGKLFPFAGNKNINQAAFYAQDSIKIGNLSIQAGLRADFYRGIISDSSVQPRIGASYLIGKSNTVLRASYTRTFETPYNENLVLSSATGSGGLASNTFGAVSQPLRPGNRNQYNAGFEQSFGHYLIAGSDYFWKYTSNAYDFAVLLNTPLALPVALRRSKIDGASARIGTTVLHGFQWTTTMGHTRARYFGPLNGGLVFNSDVGTNSVFRIDHDQAFQQRTQLRYQKGNHGPWIAWSWRYESGAVAGAVSTLDDALGLSGAQQSAIGFYCGSATPSIGIPLTSAQCNVKNYGATRLNIPLPGTANDDHNPARLAPRHLFDLGLGTDNLFHKEHVRTTLKFAINNMGNKIALYNFLSTFSGTHFVAPRSYQVALGLVF